MSVYGNITPNSGTVVDNTSVSAGGVAVAANPGTGLIEAPNSVIAAIAAGDAALRNKPLDAANSTHTLVTDTLQATAWKAVSSKNPERHHSRTWRRHLRTSTVDSRFRGNDGTGRFEGFPPLQATPNGNSNVDTTRSPTSSPRRKRNACSITPASARMRWWPSPAVLRRRAPGQ